MNALQNTSRPQFHRTLRGIVTTITATGLVVGLAALPASARLDPGPINPPSQANGAHFCTPERLGTQYVACDNLTGNGVPAPAWVHER